MKQRQVKRFSILGFLVTLSLFGCGNEGGGGLPPTPPSSPKVLFSTPSTSNTVNQGDTFTRTVEVRGVEKAFNAAFDLTYDPTVIQYVGAAEGPFLSRNRLDSTSFSTALQDGAQGRIVTGLTRLGRVDGVSGNGALVTLSFQAIGLGSTTLAFADPKGLKNNVNQDMTIDSWENATVIVQ